MNAPVIPSEPFRKLRDPHGYVACKWDMIEDEPARRHWTGFMKRNLQSMLRRGIESARSRGDTTAQRRADECTQEFNALFDRLADSPEEFGQVTMLTLDLVRDRTLRRHGFADPYFDLKERENQAALALLPEVCAELDAMDPAAAFRATIEGVFAGNVFDMGAEATARAFENQSPDFAKTRRDLPPRPWLVDGFDALAERALGQPGYRKAVIFIDNAGSDFMLGVVPLARWLARRGATVVLAANDLPTLNDMTYHDVQRWWSRVLKTEPSLETLPITHVNTGTGEPLIDLGNVSSQLNAASADAELVVLVGMGRGIESNGDVVLSCDVANLAMIKDEAVAGWCGGKLFDVVCRFAAGDRQGVD